MSQTPNQVAGGNLLSMLLLFLTDPFLLIDFSQLQQSHLFMLVIDGNHTDFNTARLIFNDQLNAVMASVFVLIVLAVVLSSLREWIRIVRGGTPVTTAETPFVESAYVA